MAERLLYFATSRAPVQGAPPADAYAGIADPVGVDRLHLGTARVAEAADTEAEHKVLAVTTTGGDGTATPVRAVLRDWLVAAEAASAMPLLFVHGFMNDFGDALGRAAQIAGFYAKAQPAVALLPMVFTWPSPGAFGLKAYKADQLSAKLAGAALARLLRELAALDGAARKPLRLLAHSMGNWCLQHAMAALAGEGGAPPGLFRSAILAAADTEADALGDPKRLGGLAAMADRVTIAVHPSDPVLALLSDAIVGNGPRLGLGPRGTVLPANVAVIDYAMCLVAPDVPGGAPALDAEQDATWNSIYHQYYRNCAEVRDDLALALRLEDAFPRRKSYKAGEADGLAFPPRTDAGYWYWVSGAASTGGSGSDIAPGPLDR